MYFSVFEMWLVKAVPMNVGGSTHSCLTSGVQFLLFEKPFQFDSTSQVIKNKKSKIHLTPSVF